MCRECAACWEVRAESVQLVVMPGATYLPADLSVLSVSCHQIKALFPFRYCDIHSQARNNLCSFVPLFSETTFLHNLPVM
jgi:hypothetical protein